MNVGILGLGLIGGSMARAFSKMGHTVLAVEKDESIFGFAELTGAVHGNLADDSIPSCDLILLAIYPEGCAKWLEENAHFVNPDALVMDLCTLLPSCRKVRLHICGRTPNGRFPSLRFQSKSLQSFPGRAHGSCAPKIR